MSTPFEEYNDFLKSLLNEQLSSLNEQQITSNIEFEVWCDLLDFYAQTYYDNCEFKIMPLAQLVLYARGELKIEKDIELDKNNVHSPAGLVVAYRDYEDIMHGFTYSTHAIYDEEIDDYNLGGKNRVLLCTTPNKGDEEEGNEHYTYAVIERILEENIKSYAGNSHATISAFEFYDFLCQQPVDVVRENLRPLFEMVMKRFTEPMYKEYYGASSGVCEEFYKLIASMLDKKQSNIIYHPAAGPGNIIKHLNERDIIATTYTKSEYLYIYFLYQLTLDSQGQYVDVEMDLMTDDVIWSGLNCLNRHFGFPQYIKTSFILFDNINFEKNFLRLLWEEITYRWNSIKGCFLVHSRDLVCLKELLNGRYSFDCAISFAKTVSKVIFMPNELVAIIIDKQKEENCNITLVDATDEEKFTAKNVLRNIRTGKKCYELTIDEFADTDFRFDINSILRRRINLRPKKGMKVVQLKELLLRPHLDIYNLQTIQHKIDYYALNYSSFLPYYSLNGKTLKNINEREVANYTYQLLLVNINEIRKYQPKIFVINDGFTQGIEFGEVWQYKIKKESVDARYLINEMTKEYFIKQLFPCSNVNVFSEWQTFLDCYIYIPDEKETLTPVERQKLLLNAEKMEFINELLQSYDYDIEKIVATEKGCLPKGTKLYRGQYIILESISSGGFGKTYKAKYIGNDSKQFAHTVAIKEFFDDKFQKRTIGTTDVINPSNHMKMINVVRKKFFEEAKKIKEFSDCDNIVKVYEVFDENNTSYYSMEYIEGKSLQNYVPRGGALEEAEAVHIIRQVAHALKRMHGAKPKMLHLDVKPSNIMIADDGRVVLIDFGTAHRNLEKISDCSTVLNIKSNGYSPRDQIKSADETYDIYSLGATLLYMLGGIKEEEKEESHLGDYEGVLPNTLVSISEEIQQCIDKSMQDRPCNRPQSIDEFLAMLPS